MKLLKNDSNKYIIDIKEFLLDEAFILNETEELFINKDSNLEPGKILEVKNSKILIKTADKSILITKHDFVNLPKINTYAS